ncbi:type III pantothenate kinase [Winogradskyella undariae]|uniref:type III pantothenate kinase n=1 Tax=Winogradskyella undariae TaxID=1285465 RepID=UPI0015CB171B|nr:type III pantothenate kinase [Winogradskyella undariae]QNK76420.1 type III pantothenate kinase [Winogradskyella sp. PAMC22761]
MNLIVDVGNTYVKFAIFNFSDLIYKTSFELNAFAKQYKLLKKEYPKLEKAIISSVGYLSKDQVAIITKDLNVIELSSDLSFPFKNGYQTPKTLGVDRMALVCASVNQFPNKNILIIDAGTCITYDFITKDNHYLGGAISPGLRLRYKALNNLTANLPLLDNKMPNKMIGDTTESAIHSGVVLGTIKEIDGVIEDYIDQYPDLTVILTGGDTNFLSNQLKNSIFANSNFLLEGLNYILEYNSK